MNKLEELIKIARHQVYKRSFVDPAMAAGGGDPAAMGMDPSAMGAPPAAGGMDPAAMGGGEGGGGAPPADPALESRLAAIESQLAGGGGAAGGVGGGVEPIKPKIDVNVEMMQIKNMLAKIIDTMGIPVPAQEMTATPEKLTQMAMGSQASAGGAGAGGAPGGGAFPPIEPIGGGGGAAQVKSGRSLAELGNYASAIATVLKRNG